MRFEDEPDWITILRPYPTMQARYEALMSMLSESDKKDIYRLGKRRRNIAERLVAHEPH